MGTKPFEKYAEPKRKFQKYFGEYFADDFEF